MNCSEMQRLLHGLLDGELDAVNAVRFEEHARTCPACARAYEEQKALRRVLGRPSLRYRAPAHLRRRIEAATIGHAVRPQPAASWWRQLLAKLSLQSGLGALAFALAASLLVFIVAPGERGGLEQELVASHVRSLLADHLTDVTTSDQHVVKPWFNGRLDASPPVIDLANHGFALIGGRLDYVDGRVVAALVYRRRDHVINLFVWPNPDATDREPRMALRQGYNILHWTRSGLVFWAVSDLNPTELQAFETLYRSATAAS